MGTNYRNHHLPLAKLVKNLLDGTASVPEMALASGFAHSTIRLYLKAFQQERVTRIVDRESSVGRGGAGRLLYALNPDSEPDAKLERMTSAQKAKRYRSRKREAITLGIRKARERNSSISRVEDLGTKLRNEP
jgi:DNA-binding IclR family transcriptional regulator